MLLELRLIFVQQQRMISLKRTIGFLTAAIIVGTSIPAQSANPHNVPNTNRSLIRATPYYQEFNPLNGPAQVTLTVTGATALDVRVRVFKTHRQIDPSIMCDDNPFYKVADLVSPYSQLGTGSHVVSWSGMMSTSKVAGDGAYCYRADWTNSAAGVRSEVEGTLMVKSTIPVNHPNNGSGNGSGAGNNNPPIPPSSASNNNGASNSFGNVGPITNYPQQPIQSTVATEEPTSPDLIFSIHPQDIYPASSNGSLNTAIIAYRTTETFSHGLTVSIRDGNNYILQTLYSTTRSLSPVSTSKSWNGRSNLTGRAYAAGSYSVVFSTNGREITRGIIRVHSGTGPTGDSGQVDNGGDTSTASSRDISVNVHPSTIYPSSNNPSLNTAILDYRVLSTLSHGLSINIYSSGNSLIRTLKSSTASLSPVSTSVSWNGRYSNGSIVPYANYRYVFKSGNIELASGYIMVAPVNNPTPNPTPNPSQIFAPVITDYGPNPSSFVQGGSTTFGFKVSQSSKVTFTVYMNNKKVTTLLNQSQVNFGSTKYVTWSSNTPGTYTYTIEASNSNGRALTKSGSVKVSKKSIAPPSNGTCFTNFIYDFKKCPIIPPTPPTPPSANMDITAVSVVWNPVSPVLNFTLNQDAYVNVSIGMINNPLASENRATGVRVSAITNKFYTSGTHQLYLSTSIIENITGYSYSIKVDAKSVANNTTDTEYTTLSANGTPTPTGCGSFRDVQVGHPMCAAINFVTSRGIFAGYPDGTLGLNRPIQRAEFLAVIQKGFRFNLDPYSSMSDGALGYRDLSNMVGQWFMPYVKTFSRLNVMVGYPDHTMHPERIIGTAEFLVSFFQAAERSPYAITRYRVNREVDHQPYADTPVNQDTYWYMGYAAFAKMNDLIPGNYMYPARGITRGQVIDFIYQTYQKGIIQYGASLVTPTYPAQTYQDSYYFNDSTTTYPYDSPIIDCYNSIDNNCSNQNSYNGSNPNYGDPSYGDQQTNNYDQNGYDSTYGSTWQWQQY